VSAPMPMLQFGLGGKTTTSFAVTRPATPAPAMPPRPSDPAQAAPAPEPEEPPANDALTAKAEEPSVDRAPPGKADASSAEVSNKVEPAAAPTPKPAEPPAHPVRIAEAETPSPETNSQVELIIDSLTHHTLIEPIPITIDALGGMMFTASMRDCDIQITGSSIGEALLVLKERIESVYDDLNRRWQNLDTDQREQLKILHTFIAPPSKRAERHLGRR
jgi:hypothetical protein